MSRGSSRGGCTVVLVMTPDLSAWSPLLIDLAHREPVVALHAQSEGMTDSPTGGLSIAGAPALEQCTRPEPPNTGVAPITFSGLNSVRRPASASRTCGRCAVPLRAILDPDA